jgi:HEAT repeat protein
MPDFAFLDIATVLDRAEKLAQDDSLPEGEERRAVVSELHRRGSSPVYEAATRWCASQQPLLRSLGADVLGQLGFSEGYPFAEPSTQTLMELLKDREPNVVDSALVALGHLNTGDLHTICALVSHASPEVRYAVAFCLGGRDDELAIQTLERLSRDEDADVRNWATFGLGTLSKADTPALRDALLERLADDDADVRGEAMRGLALRRDVRAARAILDELQRPEVSDLAIEAACEMPRKEFLPLLEALLAAEPQAEHVRLAIEQCRRTAV